MIGTYKICEGSMIQDGAYQFTLYIEHLKSFSYQI